MKQQQLLYRILGGASLLPRGGCGHDITMLMVEAVGIDGGGRVEGLVGGGKSERNGRHRDDIVLVLVTKIACVACPPFVLPLACLSHP